ncbi:MAG TPA: enolase C-terminal domain-like protein [Acetobacteraceae bacterium]|jgi:galactonate dehydratase
MPPDPIARLGVSVADVTPKTRWIFVDLETAAGVRGVGEATLGGHEQAVIDAVGHLVPAIFALDDAGPDDLRRPELPGLPEAAAFSALDQALWDVAARRRGVRLADALGDGGRDPVPVYANINRRTLERTPAGFAASARDALAAGHTAFKIAPFDEATPEQRRLGTLMQAVQPGLARIAAVREAIGADHRLMVDCHWRLDDAAATHVTHAAAELGVHWVECPLPETDDQITALANLRRLANRLGVLLAGCELGICVDGFMPFLRAGAYDVMMPDVKYVGGMAEMLRLADHMQRAGVGFSPHNPSGPVCHAVSLQLSAAVGTLHSLETQFDETPMFASLAGDAFPPATAGAMPLPADNGIGMTVAAGPLAACRSAHWIATRDRPQLAPTAGN